MWLDSTMFFLGRCDGALVFEGWCDGFLNAVRCFFKGDGFLRDGVMFFEGRCDGSSSTNWLPSSGSHLGAFFIGSVSGFRLDKYFSMVQKGSNDSNHKPSILCSTRLVPKEPSRLSVFAFKILSSYLLTSSEAVWGFEIKTFKEMLRSVLLEEYPWARWADGPWRGIFSDRLPLIATFTSDSGLR